MVWTIHVTRRCNTVDHLNDVFSIIESAKYIVRCNRRHCDGKYDFQSLGMARPFLKRDKVLQQFLIWVIWFWIRSLSSPMYVFLCADGYAVDRKFTIVDERLEIWIHRSSRMSRWNTGWLVQSHDTSSMAESAGSTTISKDSIPS